MLSLHTPPFFWEFFSQLQVNEVGAYLIKEGSKLVGT